MIEESELHEAILRLGEDAALVGLLFSFLDEAERITLITPNAAAGLYRLVAAMEKDIGTVNEAIIK